MKTTLRIGLWEHWFKLEYHIGMFLNERGVEVTKIDYTRKGYLDQIDVLIISQNGVNDFIENDRNYFHAFVRRGGICWIQHQDHFRCNPCFLPAETGRPLLVSRYYQTLAGGPPSTSYLMPWVEEAGRALFHIPNSITPDEMVYWELDANSFSPAAKMEPHPVTTCALSAITDTASWEILGSYLDPAMPDDSALVIQKTYGEGLFFWTQILFPETNSDPSGKVLKFWERFAENILEHFRRFTEKEPKPFVRKPLRAIDDHSPGWRRTITHIHSLDWFAADHHLGTLNAAMRELRFDVAVLGVKDTLSYHNHPRYDKYSDDRVTLLPGMEYHPFNFNGNELINAYHILAIGDSIGSDQFTRSLFDNAEVDQYIRSALRYIKEHSFLSCATHPNNPYWRKYDFDAVDTYDFEIVNFPPGTIEKRPFRGSDQELAWLEGSHITLMASVDMWGVERLRKNPLCNMIWYDGAPTITNLISAVKKGHVIPGFGVLKADIRMGEFLPGDTIPMTDRDKDIHVRVSAPERLTAVELYADECLVFSAVPSGEGKEVDLIIPTAGISREHFLRIEVRGVFAHLIANPFFMK